MPREQRITTAFYYSVVSSRESTMWWFNEGIKVFNKEHDVNIPTMDEEIKNLQNLKESLYDRLTET